MKINVVKNILDANDQMAAENKLFFEKRHIVAVNIMASPGAGKTSLILRTIEGLGEPIAVIEGDIASTFDAEKVGEKQVPVVQINTDGACHLDAVMVASALAELDLAAIDLLLIENVGNLVCTAGFDLGEHLRIVLLGVTEGDDKAVKYPAIFQGADALVLTKLDLLPHTNFRVERITADMRRLAPRAEVFQLSALHGPGTAPAAEWIAARCGKK